MPAATKQSRCRGAGLLPWARRLALALGAIVLLLLAADRPADAAEVRVGGLLSDTTGTILDAAPPLPGPLGTVVDDVDEVVDDAGELLDDVVTDTTGAASRLTDPVTGPVAAGGLTPPLPGIVPGGPAVSIPTISPPAANPPSPRAHTGLSVTTVAPTGAPTGAPSAAPPEGGPETIFDPPRVGRNDQGVAVASDRVDVAPATPASPTPSRRSNTIPDVGGWAFDRLRDEGRTMFMVFLAMCACLLVLGATQLRIFLAHRLGRPRTQLHPRPG